MASDQFWVASEWKGVQQFSPSTAEWRKHPMFPPRDDVTCLAVDTNYVIFGRAGIHGGAGIFSLARQQTVMFHGFEVYLKGKLKSLEYANDVCSLLVKGDKLWIGGAGCLGRIDMAARRVEALCVLNNERANVRCIEIDGPDLWVAAGKDLYRIPVPSAKRLAVTDK